MSQCQGLKSDLAEVISCRKDLLNQEVQSKDSWTLLRVINEPKNVCFLLSLTTGAWFLFQKNSEWILYYDFGEGRQQSVKVKAWQIDKQQYDGEKKKTMHKIQYLEMKLENAQSIIKGVTQWR